jgi:hypothetical protein
VVSGLTGATSASQNGSTNATAAGKGRRMHPASRLPTALLGLALIVGGTALAINFRGFNTWNARRAIRVNVRSRGPSSPHPAVENPPAAAVGRTSQTSSLGDTDCRRRIRCGRSASLPLRRLRHRPRHHKLNTAGSAAPLRSCTATSSGPSWKGAQALDQLFSRPA